MLKKLSIGLAGVLVSILTASPVQAAPVEVCKVQTQFKGNVAEQPWLAEVSPGFPKGPNRLKSFGTIKAAMLFVEFTDVKGTDNPLTEAKKFTDFFDDYWTSVTRSQLEFDFSVHPKYIKINNASSKYKMHIYNEGDPYQYFNDAIKAADPVFDFTGIEVVYVIPPSGIKKIVYGPALPIDTGGYVFKTNEALIYSGSVGGSDSRNKNRRLRGVWLAHETGHLFGFPHPYTEKNAAAWDLMNWDLGAPELLGWSRFRNGWVTDDEVTCIDATSAPITTTSVTLEPLSRVATGKKLVVVKIDEYKVLVLENRRATKVDLLSKREEGVIAYVVDMKTYGDYYVKFIGPKTLKNTRILASNQPGTAITFEKKVKVTFKQRSSKGDSLTISKAN